MTLEVIGAGFGRTGTLSMQEAINILYEKEGKQCYHFGSIVTQPEHASMWIRLLSERCAAAQVNEGRKRQNKTKTDKDDDDEGHDDDVTQVTSERQVSIDWDEMFESEGFVATMDHPCAEFYEELMYAYPNAKVILTRHPGGREKWYQSKLGHQLLIDAMHQWPLKPFARIAIWFFTRKMKKNGGDLIPHEQMMELVRLTERNVWGEKGVHDAENALGRYDAWYARVKRIVPKERLLEYDVSMGWEPLCEFLGKPVPRDGVEFPKATNHSSKEMKQFTARAETCAWIFLGVVASGIAGVMYALAT